MAGSSDAFASIENWNYSTAPIPRYIYRSFFLMLCGLTELIFLQFWSIYGLGGHSRCAVRFWGLDIDSWYEFSPPLLEV